MSKRVFLGDLVTWISESQTIVGSVVNITRRLSADGEYYRYLIIEDHKTKKEFGLFEHIIPKLRSKILISHPADDDRICREYDEYC